MFQYVVSRVLWLVPTLLAMALVTFLVMHATPGSPLDPVAEGANPLSPEGAEGPGRHYGLDKPLWQQFAIFLGKAVRGDFGYSFVYKTRTVAEILRETFPISLFLGIDGPGPGGRRRAHPRHPGRRAPEPGLGLRVGLAGHGGRGRARTSSSRCS